MKKLVCLAILPALLLALLGGTKFGAVKVTHAPIVSSDPLVVIAVDVTSTHCVTWRTIYTGNTPKTTTSPCLPGTTMKTLRVPRSRAVAQHDSYVLVPATNAPQSVRQNFELQVRAMVDAKRELLRQRGHSPAAGPHAMRPDTCYGSVSGNVGTYDIVDGDGIDAWVYYYVNYDCSSVYVDYTTVELVSNYYNPLYWWAAYDSQTWWDKWYPGCQTIAPPDHTYTLTVDASQQYASDWNDQFVPGCDSTGNYYLEVGLMNS